MPPAADPVLALYAALEQGDLGEALDGCLHPEVRWRSSPTMPWGAAVEGRKGRDAVREYLMMLGEHLDAEVEIDDVVETEDRVVTLGVISGTAKSTGARFEARFAHVWTVVDGRIVDHRGFPDTAAVMNALAGSGSQGD